MTFQQDDLIRATVDLHYHSGPSPFPRRLDPVESAQHYDEHGFKAVVYKSHHHNTVMDVLSIRTSALDKLRVRAFGGIALNGLVGGLNPRAVEMCLRMGGKIVWFPTISSPAHVEYHNRGGGFPRHGSGNLTVAGGGVRPGGTPAGRERRRRARRAAHAQRPPGQPAQPLRPRLPEGPYALKLPDADAFRPRTDRKESEHHARRAHPGA